MVEQQPAECFVCDKHKGGISVPGGAIYEDELVYVSHASISEGQSAGYLGSLVVEPRRDVSNLGGLTDVEAQPVGFACCLVQPSCGERSWSGGPLRLRAGA